MTLSGAEDILQDYFTPNDYQYVDCNDAELLLIPGTKDLVAGGKTGKLYLVNTINLGQEQANDAGATQTLWFESTLSAPYSSSCTDALGTQTTEVNSYEIFGTSTYFRFFCNQPKVSCPPHKAVILSEAPRGSIA